MKLTGELLSRELKGSGGEFLGYRRAAASLTLLGMTSLAVIALYQFGVLKRLPEPSSSILNAEKVNGSPEAYGLLQMPDAVLGIGSYAATLGLVVMGGADRAVTASWIPLALLGKSSLDTTQAAAMTLKSWTHFRAFSLYSLVTVLTTFLALPLVIPEAKAAWRQIRKRH
jgi:hypothetical protein